MEVETARIRFLLRSMIMTTYSLSLLVLGSGPRMLLSTKSSGQVGRNSVRRR